MKKTIVKVIVVIAVFIIVGQVLNDPESKFPVNLYGEYVVENGSSTLLLKHGSYKFSNKDNLDLNLYTVGKFRPKKVYDAKKSFEVSNEFYAGGKPVITIKDDDSIIISNGVDVTTSVVFNKVD